MQLISFIRTKYKNIFNGLLFVFTIAAIVLLLPREGKFKYEFQKGKPWRHETLMAPYDFPIYKNQKQIKAEKDSILEHTYPYFKYDSSVVTSQISNFREHYTKQYSDFKDALKNETTIPQWKIRRMNNNSEKYQSKVIQLLRDVYSRGVVVPSEITSSFTDDSKIFIFNW